MGKFIEAYLCPVSRTCSSLTEFRSAHSTITCLFLEMLQDMFHVLGGFGNDEGMK
jgi:hypothetical protein